MKKIIVLTIAAITLSACHLAPSPQDTTPDKASRCKALKMKMNDPSLNNNSSTAVDTADSMDYAQAYKNECE